MSRGKAAPRRRPPDLELPNDLLAEIEAARPSGRHHNCCVWPPEADRALLVAASGEAPVPLVKLSDIFRARKWPHDTRTIKKRLDELRAEGAKP